MPRPSGASPAPRPVDARPPRLKADDAAEKNRPLVEDIRLLGRILGDVIREQEGKEAIELSEDEADEERVVDEVAPTEPTGLLEEAKQPLES